MKHLFAITALCLAINCARSQAPVYQDQPFGKVDQADLQMTACDFEKDANAEVLIDAGKYYYGEDLKTVVMEYHERIKVFNANGFGEADIHFQFEGVNHEEFISNLEAETINLVDGKSEVTKIDKKSFYTKPVDDEYSELSFTFPNVKPGSILEYKFRLNSKYNAYLPTWNFQSHIPVRYSELSVAIPDLFYFRVAPRVYQDPVKHNTTITPGVLKEMTHTLTVGGATASSDQQTDTYTFNVNNETWGMANVPGLHTDSYTSSYADNVQRISFDPVSFKPINGFETDYSSDWSHAARNLADSRYFGEQLNRGISGEDAILSHAQQLKNNDERIAYIFDTVKNAMKWNGINAWFTIDGPPKAWDAKSGNSAEINIIVYHLLKKLNIPAYPMVVSTRDNGRPDPYTTSTRQFNSTVVMVPVDSSRRYVLDATSKYNIYNETPANLLNTFGLCINKAKRLYDTVSIVKNDPVRKVILINAEIKPAGTLQGTSQVNDVSYDRINAKRRYKTDGEEKYIKYLQDGDNDLKITSLKFENMEVDTLPLTQNIEFSMHLAGSDNNYIYLNPNIFTGSGTNPFLAETRQTDIYMGYLRTYSINGVFKLPAGYAVDALPKSVSMAMPDKSIIFKRIVAQQEGSLVVRFVIDFKKKAFSAAEYPAVHDFYKKMFDMLNEQIALKKS